MKDLGSLFDHDADCGHESKKTMTIGANQAAITNWSLKDNSNGTLQEERGKKGQCSLGFLCNPETYSLTTPNCWSGIHRCRDSES